MLAVGRGAESGEVAAEPAGPWRASPTRTFADRLAVAAAEPDADLTLYGGTRAPAPLGPATGFFRVARAPDGRGWLLDPAGARYRERGGVVTPSRRLT